MFEPAFRTLALLLACTIPSLASAALPAGLSGAWYNPLQSGHGLSIQILSRSSALVFWYATDPQGNPLNLYIEARVENDSLVGTALAPRGMRFGDWNRDDLEVPVWGEVRVAFLDCDRASLSWSPDGEAGAGFPSGSMPLRRLTRLDSHSCSLLAPPARPETGLYRASLASAFGAPQLERAAIDEHGTLYALEIGTLGDRTLIDAGAARASVVLGTAQDDAAGATRGYSLLGQLVDWPVAAAQALDVEGVLSLDADGRARAAPFSPARPYGLRSIELHGRAAELEAYDDARPPDIAGRYGYLLGSPPFTRMQVRLLDDGGLCLAPETLDRCELSGELVLRRGNRGFFDFSLGDFRGRGWVARRSDGTRELVLIGSDGRRRLGLVALDSGR